VRTEELRDLSSDIIERDDMEAGYATRLGNRRGACSGLVGKHEGRSPLYWKIILILSFKEQNFEGTFC